MQKNSRFLGTIVALAGSATTVLVGYYFWATFWKGEVLDLDWHVSGQKIPPESYPILLLTIWTIAQRAKARWRPHGGAVGRFWHGEDLVEAVVAAIFLIYTMVQAFALGTNLTFVFVLVAFSVQAIVDLILNGTHIDAADTSSASAATASASTAAGEVAEDEIARPEVDLVVRRLLFMGPDGKLRPWRMLPGPAIESRSAGPLIEGRRAELAADAHVAPAPSAPADTASGD